MIRKLVSMLRNTRGATGVASFSLRARTGAPVAMPLRWQDLGRCTGADAFHIRSVRQRLARLRGDPWEGFSVMQQSLDKAMRMYGNGKD